MSILDRFSTIIKANINDLLDKAEDPSKLVDQYLRDLTEDLAEVKKDTAAVMAEETRCKRMLDENEADSKKYDELARKALGAGEENDARVFIAKKQELDAAHEGLATAYAGAKNNADKMRQMHDKLVSDIETLKSRQASIKAKVSVAKTQQKVNGMTGADKAAGAIDAFSRMEAKADAMLDQADAMAELNSKPVDEAAELEAKYSGVNDASVDAELAKMKADMGL